MLYLIGIVIDFFLVVLLLSKNNKSKADKILVLWLALTGIQMTLFYLYYTGAFFTFPFFLGLELPLPLVHGPLLYLYTCALTDQPVKGKHSGFHLIPVLIFYVLMIPFVLHTSEYKIAVYQHKGQGYEGLIKAMNIVAVLSGITYVSLSLYSLHRHQRNLYNQFSYTERINLAWLRYLIFGIATIWIAVIWGRDQYIYGLGTFFVFFIGYFGIKQVGIFTSNHAVKPDQILIPAAILNLPEQKENDPEEVIIDQPVEKSKYQKSGLQDEDAVIIHQKVIGYMQKDKLYLDPELTLVDLAQKLKIHPNTLSQVINSKEKKNFYDFVNAHRIEEFKRVISQPESQQYSLLGLALQCGFNSKTSFNRNFKKTTGLTPTDFLRQININLN